MQPPHQHSRINLAELKAQIVRKLGSDRSKQYFYSLNRLLSLKISKVEFSKICLRIFGRENILLHNQFIRSILKNACSAKVPPSSHEDEFLKPGATLGNNEASNDVYEQNGSRVSLRQSSSQPGLSNGDILPLSPRKARTGFCDRRAGDGRSALGPNEKTSFTFQSTAEESSDFDVTKENGYLNPPDGLRSVQHNPGLIQRSEDEREAANLETSKLSLTKRPLGGPVSVHNKDQVSGDGKEMHARSELQAPLGVPFYPVSVVGSHRELPLATSSKCFSFSNFGALLDTLTLRERMEQIAAEQGIEGVAVDCANLVNNGLDSYLKGLIGSCVQLLGARSGHEPTKISRKKQQTYTKPVNGLRPGHHIQVSSDKSSEFMQEQAPDSLISFQDFRVAMELNRQQLGKDWPLLLEKPCRILKLYGSPPHY
ncbi:uncharacterized protein [Nicotiana tomentosiformis]|uniref:uncharacterized protein isoform X1 n=1 Tax=Nicotiana tomentosiformis TaxID=4098 RepID=UPI00051C1BB1|nr:uncharacterized protein LOC104094601 isoform X1 [Nicotiana tomentosiformis]XP_033511597.1 uncharacterized protein LOC104094601 isoform X1 [Nicotiana tomentosiformis]XP_033511598.1 uncharacterized protein LOC104094601 isoform X1 [Nicotiana tomentosiformis]XP_033511599.1 uncharacterized protein LOC104094601 isoform X1 [Nicotiana tomentosiformis]